MAKSYHGSIILSLSPQDGRRIEIGERVRDNQSGLPGTVVSMIEGSRVFAYFVCLDRFDRDGFLDETTTRLFPCKFKTDEITPLVNP